MAQNNTKLSFHSSRVQNVPGGLYSFWRLQRKIHLLPFLASRGHLHSLAHGPTLHLQSQQGSTSQSFSLSLCFHCHISDSGPPVSLYMNPYYYIELIQIIQNNLLITGAKSLQPHKVTYSQIPGIRMWSSLEGHYSPNHSCRILFFMEPPL